MFGWRIELPIYATAFFAGNVFPMMHVLMPLWALELTNSALIIGIIISCRQILPIFLSIHGGALLDRFGPRKVIIWMGLIGGLCTGMFPLLHFIWAAMLLQIVTGFAETTNWIGVQSAVGTMLRGKPVYAGRMTAAARLGGAIGPVLVGVMWDTFGPYGGFLFLASWIACGALMASFLPRHSAQDLASDTSAGVRSEKKGLGLMVKVSDYRNTMRLLATSAIALVIMATFVRQTGSGVQSSFYGVWLSEELGLTGTTIGFLIGFGNLVSAASALTIGPLTKRVADYWLLLCMVGFAIVGVALTPMLEGLLLLSFAIGLRGVGQGLNLPLMISIAARVVGPKIQGRVAALRISFNRLGSALFPIGMGGLAEAIGLEASFYVIGLFGIVLIGGLAVWVFRSKDKFLVL